MMPIRDMYNCTNHVTKHEKKYFNSHQDEPKLPVSELKRGSYLDDYNRIHGKIPGPGVYEYAKDEWPKKPAVKGPKPSKRKTFIDELMEKSKKEKQPAPGHYKVVKSVKEMDAERKRLARKKTHYQDRMTYLDGVQYEAAQTPGVGKYNTRPRPQSSANVRKDKPEEWRKKHDDQKKKKPEKQPDMGSYNPRSAKSFERKPGKEGLWDRRSRFETEKSAAGPALGPGKYIKEDDWAKPNNVVASRVRPKSAYYN